MSQRRVTETSLAATADALRAKLGTSDPITWEVDQGFKEAVESIPTDAGGGGELKDLDVTPSHEAQEFIPAEGVAGYKKVTVRPVPRVPACQSGIEWSEFIQTHAKYAGMRFPLIPEDELVDNPYAFIWFDSFDTNAYLLFYSPITWGYRRTSSKGKYLTKMGSGTSRVYKYSAELDAWEFYQTYTSSELKIASYSGSYSFWTNFDVPNYNDTTEVSIAASAPVVTL